MTQAADAPDNRFGLKAAVIHQINSVLADYPEVERAVIYGSRSKGNYKPGSDIDLTLVGNQLTEARLLELETRLDDLLLPYKLDLNRYETLSNQKLKDHINRVGQDFYVRR